MEIKCSVCGKVIKPHDGFYRLGDGYVCSNCVRTNNHIKRCSRCDEFFLVDETDTDRRLCDKCKDEIYTNTLNSYSTKPDPIFKNKYGKENSKNLRYYGLEMEFSYVNPLYARVVFDSLYKDKLIYNKSDSSLSEGVEIVTSPCDKKNIINLLDRMKEGLCTFDSSSSHNAGVHIHVSKSSIDRLSQYKMSLLFNYKHNYNDYFKRLIYYLVGRNTSPYDSSSYYQYALLGDINDMRRLLSHDTRRQCINFSNTNTIEFRFFRSSNDVDVIKSYIEFVDKIIEYCTKYSFKDMNIGLFIRWLNDNTNNEILIHKIAEFLSKNSGFDCKELSFNYDVDLLKGINVDDYIHILNSMDCSYNVKTFRNTISLVKTYGVSRRRTVAIDESKLKGLLRKMFETYKKVQVNKIMKGLEQCA